MAGGFAALSPDASAYSLHGNHETSILQAAVANSILRAVAVFVGLFLWNVTPDFRPLIAWVLAAAFLYYVLSAIVEAAVKRLIWDELQELRSRLEVLDRKVSAILTGLATFNKQSVFPDRRSANAAAFCCRNCKTKNSRQRCSS